MANKRDAPEHPLDAEAALRRGNQSPRVGDPVRLDAHVPESSVAAERTELARVTKSRVAQCRSSVQNSRAR